MVFRRLFALVICLLLAACAGKPMHGISAAKQVPSPNFDVRRPSLVVLHHTGSQNADTALKVLTSPSHKVSAHYLISKPGQIIQLVDERNRAWHAGVSKWRNTADINSVSIGIELDNNGVEPYNQAQINSLIMLLQDLKKRYRLATTDFVSHADVAPGRKVDPGALFPWEQLSLMGIGIWCSQPWPVAPEDFDLLNALNLIGYDTSNFAAARHSFLLHYAKGQQLTYQQEKNLAYCLVNKTY